MSSYKIIRYSKNDNTKKVIKRNIFTVNDALKVKPSDDWNYRYVIAEE